MGAVMSTSTFLVRDADTGRMVGLFCARRSNDLFCLLDERVDPFGCEYLELRPGEGVFVGPEGLMPTVTRPPVSPDAGNRWRTLDLPGFTAVAR